MKTWKKRFIFDLRSYEILGLWTAEDDLPLSDIRQILYINGLESTSADSVTDICMTEKQKPQVCFVNRFFFQIYIVL